MKTIIKLSIFLLFAFISIQENKSQTSNEDKTLSPYFFIQSEDPSVESLPLKSTIADVIISGVIADVTVTQIYKNEGEHTIEAIYVFPGSTRAAVYAMTMNIGERTIEAQIKGKQQAREDYENAIEEGKTASLLEQERPNIFQMTVGNIMPGDVVKVVLKYTELLIPDEGVYEFVYPTVVGPRYVGKEVKLGETDDSWVTNPYTKEGEKPLYAFDIDVELFTGIPIAQVKSISHQVNIKYAGESSAIVTMADDKFGGNKDFILQYSLEGKAIESGIILYEGEDENFFLAMIQPPKQIYKADIPPREYVFIMDVSGSMNGFPLEISKKLIKDLLGSLKPIDKFNILFFAGGSEMLSEHSLFANESNIQKAIRFVDDQKGGGGTELLPALQKALSFEKTDNFSRTFIIATDGYVTVEKEAFDLIRDNLGNANFFPFGIGTGVNRYILEGMAHVGKGNSFIATSQSEALVMGDKFRRMINNPVLTNIKIDFNGFDAYDIEPTNVPDVFSERPILIFGKYRGKVTGDMTINGNTGGKDYFNKINIAKESSQKKNTALKYLWAREKIKLLDDYAQVDYGVSYDHEITALGLKYNLLTAYTSFVAIDSEVRNVNGAVITVQQPLPLPEGVSNYAVSTSLGKKLRGNGVLGSNPKSEAAETMSYEMTLDDEDFEEEISFYVVEEMPEFIGGEIGLNEFLANNIRYPQNAKEGGVEGTVYVSFTVTRSGKVKDVVIVLGVSEEIDEEAVRVIKLSSSQWTPGKQNEKAVDCSYLLPIKFKL